MTLGVSALRKKFHDHYTPVVRQRQGSPARWHAKRAHIGPRRGRRDARTRPRSKAKSRSGRWRWWKRTRARRERRQESRPPWSIRDHPKRRSTGKRADYRGITIAQTCPNSGNREIRRGECRCLAAGPVIVLSLLTTDTARGRWSDRRRGPPRGSNTLLNFENTRARARLARCSVTSSAASKCLSFSLFLSLVAARSVIGYREQPGRHCRWARMNYLPRR